MPKLAQYGFFSAVSHSVYSPAFYAGLSQKSFWSSVWYLARVISLIFFFGALIVLIPIFQNWDKIDQAIADALNFYPEELVLTFQDGQMTSNQVEPYFIEFQEIIPELWRDKLLESSDNDFQKNLVVIDTVTPYSEDQFETYDALIWLSKDTIYMEEENGKISSRPFSIIPDSVLDKSYVDEKVAILWDQIKSALPFFVVLGFIFGAIGLTLYHLIYLVILGVGVLIVGSIMKLTLNFETSYKIALHAITLPIFLSLVIMLSSGTTGFSGFPFLFSLLSLLIVALNLKVYASIAS